MSLNKLNQYFTPNQVVDLVLAEIQMIPNWKELTYLEPSCGEGVFVEALKTRGAENINIICFEKDKDLKTPENCEIREFESCFYKPPFGEPKREIPKVDIVIGNPPYNRLGGLFFNQIKKDYPKIKQIEELHLLLASRCIELGGIIAFVLPTNIIKREHFRGYLLKDLIIEKQIELPSNTFDGALINTSIFFFKKINWKIIPVRYRALYSPTFIKQTIGQRVETLDRWGKKTYIIK